MSSEPTRNIVVYLGQMRWEPNMEEQALDLFARTACGPWQDDLVFRRQTVRLVKRGMEEHCDFLKRFYDGLAEETGAVGFRIQSMVRFYNVWVGMPVMAAPDARLKAKRDEVEVTVFTGRRKILIGDEVAARFFAPLGSHGVRKEDEERLGMAYDRAVTRINAASRHGG